MTEFQRKLLLTAVGVLACWQTALGQSMPDHSVYTLYRDSPLFPGTRIHIATFDASEGELYNRENCDLVRDLFARQPGVQSRFWCERGRSS